MWTANADLRNACENVALLSGRASKVLIHTNRAMPRQHGCSRDQLAQMLDQGAQAHGFEDARWTSTRVRDLIVSEFGVTYHISTVCALLGDLGFSWQKPETRELRREPRRPRCCWPV